MAAFCFKVSAEICKRILGKKSYNSNKKIFKKIRNIWSKVYKKIHNIFNHFKMQYYKMQKKKGWSITYKYINCIFIISL